MEAKDQNGSEQGAQWIASNSTSEKAKGFHAYVKQQLHQRAPRGVKHPPRLIVNHATLVKLTKEIVETYQVCNPAFSFSEAFNPKRYLTTPYVPLSNGGLDNENSDLILAVNGELANEGTNHRYIIKDLLGQGTFGQVAKCWAEERDCFVAIKIVKNQPAYHQQAIVEVSILDMLNSKFDPEDKHQIVRMIEQFYYQEHLCIVFEMLGVNLFELLKKNNFNGFSLKLIRTFTKQTLKALGLLREANIIHCDLKPENILLTTSPESAEIKLIDFGSACREDRTVYSYIQSRFYRSPEVVLGHAYTTAIDMWSLGCVAAELFLGLPLFPAQSQYDLLQRLIKVLGKPPDFILRHAKNTSKYFKISRAPIEERTLSGDKQHSSYHFLTPDEIMMKKNEAPVVGRHYFPEDWDLEKLILSYLMKKGMSEDEMEKESWKRLVFVDFLKGLLNVDPLKRWTPSQAEQHPFLTEVPFTGPFQPRPDCPRLPIHQQVMNLDHNPVSGHWFGAGLSPQVSCNLGFQFGSPQHDRLSLSYGSSYIGSYGSFIGDMGAGPASSWGSNNGESSDLYRNHRTPPSVGLGVSPDLRRRKGPRPPNAFGHAHVGMSPSGGSFMPTSLGASPSNLTSPSSHFQPSPGSSSHFQPSPGSPSVGPSSRFGPTSPARTAGSSSGAASLGKAAAFGQYNKRRGWGSPGSIGPTTNESRSLAHESSFTPTYNSYERSSARNKLSFGSQNESVGQSTLLDSPRSPSYLASQFKAWNGEVAGTSSFEGQNFHVPNFPAGSLSDFVHKRGATLNRDEDVLPPPNPSDWDPTYSEDLLIEEGESGLSSYVSCVSNLLEVTGLNSPPSSSFLGNVFLPDCGNEGQRSAQFHSGQQMAGAYRPATTGPNYIEGGSPSSRGYARNSFYNHHPQQISQSRLGQQSSHFEQQQEQLLLQQHYPYQSLNVLRSSEQLPIPFAINHPQLGHQFLTQSINASAVHSLPYGVPAPPQSMHMNNQMSPMGLPHWASGFPGQRYGPLNRAFPSMHPRRDGRTDA